MKTLWKKQLPAFLLTLVMLASLMPAALAEELHSEHTWKQMFDDEKHWTVCDCGARTHEISHSKNTSAIERSASCYQNGTTRYTCICGYTWVEEDILPTGNHDFSNGPWLSDNTSHWKKCYNYDACTALSAKETHTPRDNGVSRNPTCTSEGTTDHICAVCGKSYTVKSADKLPHTVNPVTGKCTVCGTQVNSIATYTVTFQYLNTSAGAATTSQSVVSGGKPTNPGTPNSFTYNGYQYIFKGWTTSYTSSSNWYTYTNQTLVTPTNTTITGNTTFYAVYTVISTVSSITYTVAPGKETAFSERDFLNAYKEQYSGNLWYVTFSDLTSTDYNNFPGTVYSDKTELSRNNLVNTEFYAEGEGGRNDALLSSLKVSASSGAKSGTITMGFTAYGTRGHVSGTVKLTVSSTTSTRGDIAYKVAPGESVSFTAADFNSAYKKLSGTSDSIKWVTFSAPTAYNSFAGTLYTGNTALSRSDLTHSATDFYYSSASYGDYSLSSLSFKADKTAAKGGTLTLGFRAYYSSSRYEEGSVVITIDTGAATGDITYTVAPGKTLEVKPADFLNYYNKEYSGSIRWVEFTAPTTLSDAGVFYYNYDKTSQRSFTRTTFNSTSFYYGANSAEGDYPLDALTFAANSDFKSSVSIAFRAYYSASRYVEGTMVIRSTGSAHKLTYKVAPGKTLELSGTDFQNAYRKEYSDTIRWVEFTAPTAVTSAGTFYTDYGKTTQKSYPRANLNTTSFYYGTNTAYGDAALSSLSFVASTAFNTAVELTFRACYSDARYIEGTLVIEPDKTVVVPTSNYAGNIRYATTTGNRIQINANDIARFFAKSNPGYTMDSVVLMGVPSNGTLYYNYYGTSKFGSATNMAFTAANCSNQRLYLSPTSNSQFALTELTYVPSGSNYCTAILFTAYGGSRSVSGSILISVSSAAVAEVYGVTPKGTAVNFPVSSIYGAVQSATGTGLSSIQLLSLPSSAVGTVYAGSNAANATTAYTYGDTMNQLRFVPAVGFTGSVEIPYVALNASGTALASGTFALGVVNAQRKFSDVAASTWCYKYVAELSDANVISGYNDGTFKPNSTITYGAALKLIMLAAGYPEQKPTTSNTFSGYLAKAQSEGIITRSTVDLTRPITRLQVAQIAAGAMKLNITNLSTSRPFTDTSDLYVQALNAAGIVEGYFDNGTSTFKPNNTLTRGQVSAIVWRMRNYNK